MPLAPAGNRQHFGMNTPTSSSKPCHPLPLCCRFLPLLPPITPNVKFPHHAAGLEFGSRGEVAPQTNSKSGKNGNVDHPSQLCHAPSVNLLILRSSVFVLVVLHPPPRPLCPLRFTSLLLRPLCPSVSSVVVLVLLVSSPLAAGILVRAGPGPYNRRCGAMRAPPATTASGSPVPPSSLRSPPAAPLVSRKSHAR
jgi:hypothetical protein